MFPRLELTWTGIVSGDLGAGGGGCHETLAEQQLCPLCGLPRWLVHGHLPLGRLPRLHRQPQRRLLGGRHVL